MLRISDESYERVQDIIEDIGYCYEVEDDYNEWEDIAASSMLDLSSGDNGQIQIFELIAHSEDYLNEATVSGFFTTLFRGGLTTKSAVLGFFASLLL